MLRSHIWNGQCCSRYGTDLLSRDLHGAYSSIGAHLRPKIWPRADERDIIKQQIIHQVKRRADDHQ